MEHINNIYFNKFQHIVGAVDHLQEQALIIAIEELAELQQALTKLLRGKPDLDNLAEEYADVLLILDWIAYYIASNDVDKEFQRKVVIWNDYKKERIKKRLKEGNLN